MDSVEIIEIFPTTSAEVRPMPCVQHGLTLAASQSIRNRDRFPCRCLVNRLVTPQPAYEFLEHVNRPFY
jgi:hypothetical protein